MWDLFRLALYGRWELARTHIALWGRDLEWSRGRYESRGLTRAVRALVTLPRGHRERRRYGRLLRSRAVIASVVVTRLVVTGGCSTWAFAPPVASAAEAGARLIGRKLEASNRARAKLLLGRFFIIYGSAGFLIILWCTHWLHQWSGSLGFGDLFWGADLSFMGKGLCSLALSFGDTALLKPLLRRRLGWGTKPNFSHVFRCWLSVIIYSCRLGWAILLPMKILGVVPQPNLLFKAGYRF